MYGDGTQTRDFTYVDDIVDALVRAARPAGSVMNVGGGHRVSLSEAIAMLGETMGVAPMIDQLPVEAGDVRDTWADVSRAEAEFGYAPRTALAEGLRRECDWFSSRFGASA